MRYLVTGGSGFIGQALCSELVECGHHVVVLTRSAARSRPLLPGAVQLVETLAAVDSADAVVNLAGENIAGARWTPSRRDALRQSRLTTTRMLQHWIAGLPQRPPIVISGSAIGYYGPHGDEDLDEQSAAGEDFAALLCRDWEAEAMQIEALGPSVCRLRIGLVLDRGGGALARMLPAFRCGLGGPLGSGRQWMSWIHRRDLVALIRWLAEQRTGSGACNATAPAPVRNADFARALGRAVHRPAFIPAPALALRLALGELSSLLLTGQKVLPERAAREGFRFRYTDIEATLRELCA